ncbi:hypothetical protein AAFF_G00356000 [Aldrovandia affinis]|uniref:Uncharacterized protein n=1 Tax=Aldrovandia affinis TaxID=143900 RepID=A0AAD7R523_9TELE|nr:hypothetical protein AAFF_G00356000 [Aldrovandia affinis]
MMWFTLTWSWMTRRQRRRGTLSEMIQNWCILQSGLDKERYNESLILHLFRLDPDQVLLHAGYKTLNSSINTWP